MSQPHEGPVVERFREYLRVLAGMHLDPRLHHLQGRTLPELAGQLGRSETAVAGLLHRGLTKLRELMGKDE